MKPEQQLQNAVCDYLRLQYASTMFMVSPSGIKLTMGQAKNLKRNQNPSRGWPDLIIFQTKIDQEATNLIEYGALMLELKPDGYVLFKKDGELRKNEHTESQNEVHKRLRDAGYYALFATGFDEAKEIIDWYLK